MDIKTIETKYNELNQELKKAVSTMQFTDSVFVIKDAIRDLQKICPHDNGTYDFSQSDECPYCGKKFKG